jgi:hypothetical protein
MRVYRLDFAESRSACESCGFLCFEEEFVCPVCGKKTEPLSLDGVNESAQNLPDAHYKYWVLEIASKRGQVLAWTFFVLITLSTVLASAFFMKNHDPFHSNFYSRLVPGSYLIYVWFIWMIILGVPGFQYSRIKELRHSGYWLSRGLLRHIQDGRIAEFIWSAAVFLGLYALVAFYGPAEWSHQYYNLRPDAVSESFYVWIGMLSLQTINALWFAWHIMGNILCPYDYKAELKFRKETRNSKRSL